MNHLTSLWCDSAFDVGEIDRRLFGSFIEHMGRTVYGGIYEPDHPTADENGFRTDVLKLVREMGVSVVRYPGGNYISSYRWEDTVGPVQARPTRLELAWQQVETNEFGLSEFMKWAKKAGVEPMLAVNLGTRGLEEAAAFMEYCCHDAGSYYSELRRAHGDEAPYPVHTWCLGNEMDGTWQIGQKTSEEYGRLAAETAKVMRRICPDAELVSCGSSKSDMASYPQWDLETLRHTYEAVDLIALHQYYGGQEMGTARFLAQALDMDRYLDTIECVCDVVKAQKRSDKTLMISVDEWGVWNNSDKEIGDLAPHWRKGPAFSEQIYTMEDTLLFAGMMLSLLRHADRVKIACQSLLTNISACIMTKKGGEAWVQPIYYPFAQLARYARGRVLNIRQSGPVYACEEFADVPFLDSVVVENREQQELVLFAVNRSETQALPVCLHAHGYRLERVLEQTVLTADEKHATNKQEHDRIVPRAAGDAAVSDNVLRGSLPAFSWNVIRVQYAQ